ncbi:MAG TPA: type II CAAX endopeptidase family protein [Chloroflexota bacterium]|nr:type II CAAX endopeptidase family protein [Chloroflexota bacterium]
MQDPLREPREPLREHEPPPEPLQIVPPVREDERFAARPARREAWLEIGVFLLLIVPSMILGYFTIQTASVGFVLAAVSTIFSDLGLVALILFFLWRNGEPLTRVGWTRRDFFGEILIGILLFVPAFVLTTLITFVLGVAGLSSPSPASQSFLTPHGPLQIALALLLVVVVAIAEETVFRGYLILRFENLLPSAGSAILLSAFIFSLGHGYEGSVGVVTVGIMGIILALVYVWRRSLVAPATMHFLQDFLVIIVLPLLIAAGVVR